MKKLFFKIILVSFFVIICYLPKLNASTITCTYSSSSTYSFRFVYTYKDGKVTYLFGSKSSNIATIASKTNFKMDDFYKNGELKCPLICMKFVSGSTGKSALKIENSLINIDNASQAYCTQTVSHPVTGNDIKPRISITKDRIQYDSYETDLLDNSDDESDDDWDDDDWDDDNWDDINIPSSAPEPKKYFTQVELCSNLKFLEILKFIRLGITIITIVVPIILLVICSITLVKGMTAGDDKELSDVWLQIKNKVIAAILVFLVPTIITMTLDMIGGDNNCVSNATNESINKIATGQISTILEEGVDSGNINELKSLLLKYKNDEELIKKAEEKIDEYNKNKDNNDINDENTVNTPKHLATEFAGDVCKFGQYQTLCKECVNRYNSYYKNTFNSYTSKTAGRTFKLFKQNMKPWNNFKLERYSSDATVESTGCAITSMAILFSGYYSNITLCSFEEWYMGVDPIKLINTLNLTGGIVPSKSSIPDYLSEGKVIMIEVRGGACGAQHHMPLLDYNSNTNRVYVGDTFTISKCFGWQPLNKILDGYRTGYYINPVEQ